MIFAPRAACNTGLYVAGGIACRAVAAAAMMAGLMSSEAHADLKLCNRMSYVIEAAIGIDDKSATATRGWLRIDPAQCRVVAQGTLAADRILLHARALGVYGASPVPQNGSDGNAGSVRPQHHSPRSSRRRPTTATWWRISPRTANMTTSRPSSPGSSGCW
jgi:Protein of unknown function (DUF1036)